MSIKTTAEDGESYQAKIDAVSYCRYVSPVRCLLWAGGDDAVRASSDI